MIHERKGLLYNGSYESHKNFIFISQHLWVVSISAKSRWTFCYLHKTNRLPFFPSLNSALLRVVIFGAEERGGIRKEAFFFLCVCGSD